MVALPNTVIAFACVRAPTYVFQCAWKTTHHTHHMQLQRVLWAQRLRLPPPHKHPRVQHTLLCNMVLQNHTKTHLVRPFCGVARTLSARSLGHPQSVFFFSVCEKKKSGLAAKVKLKIGNFYACKNIVFVNLNVSRVEGTGFVNVFFFFRAEKKKIVIFTNNHQRDVNNEDVRSGSAGTAAHAGQ